MVKFKLRKSKEFICDITGRVKNIIYLPSSAVVFLQPAIVLFTITILSFEIVSLFYNMISFPLIYPSPAVRNAGIQQNIAGSGLRNQLQSYGIIAERNLFFSTLQAIGEKQLEGGFFSSGQEVTSYELKGTVAGGTALGFAVIEERGKNKQTLYRLGDMVGSAKLVEILRNAVILRKGDVEITLKIKATPEGQLFPRSSSQNTNTTAGVTPINEKPGDLKTILSQAVIRPFSNKGNQEGYIISNIRPESVYQKLGLQNGDIIMNLNNKPMRGADDVLQMANLMQSEADISLNLKRNGKVETISYSFHKK